VHFIDELGQAQRTQNLRPHILDCRVSCCVVLCRVVSCRVVSGVVRSE
jgi:hypothetical protein